jgi:hypothetical protein
MEQQFADRHMSPHSDTLSWFHQSFLFLLSDACLVEKPQPAQGEKRVPNTFIMFVFLIYRIKSCSYSYPDLFSRIWWLLNIHIKNDIVSTSNGKFDSMITWSLDIPVASLMMFVILHYFNLLYFSQIHIEKKVPVLSNHSL